ncbi:MAG: uracil-DNA glycosylase [Candidatus Marsarchaeota archaeon]|nr:uracil-DNA glycosylase [Candidatus Marsarchaeota archaeon]
MTEDGNSRVHVSNVLLDAINREIVDCTLCPRLNEYRNSVARIKTRRFRDEAYWGKPLTGFGDPSARILVVGLAPAAHGGNRTGRMFTGDSSGEFLASSLYRVGHASQPTSLSAHDGLTLKDVYITAVVRCAPPANKPLPSELENCSRYLQRELDALRNIRVIVCLGAVAFYQITKLTGCGRKKFSHLAITECGKYMVIASYHPSRRNTQTRLLTAEMLDEVFLTADQLVHRRSEVAEPS